MIPIMHTRLADIFAQGQVRRLQAGEAVFHQHDAVTSVSLVREGEVRLIRITPAGTMIVVQRAGPGQVLAEASVYSDRTHCGAVAAGAAVLSVLPVGRFRSALAADPDLSAAWSADLAHAVQSARMRAEIRTLRTVAERLDAWLGEGNALPPRGRWQDVAAELGVTREALYREFACRRMQGGDGEPVDPLQRSATGKVK